MAVVRDPFENPMGVLCSLQPKITSTHTHTHTNIHTHTLNLASSQRVAAPARPSPSFPARAPIETPIGSFRNRGTGAQETDHRLPTARRVCEMVEHCWVSPELLRLLGIQGAGRQPRLLLVSPGPPRSRAPVWCPRAAPAQKRSGERNSVGALKECSDTSGRGFCFCGRGIRSSLKKRFPTQKLKLRTGWEVSVGGAPAPRSPSARSPAA